MARLSLPALTSSLFRLVKRAWPQVPLGLLLLFTGAVNGLTGLQIHGLSTAYQILDHVVSLLELRQAVSIGILGSSVQILLGGGMLITGVGLFWRLRFCLGLFDLVLVYHCGC